MHKLQPSPSPWHAGEKQLQARVGVAEQMEVFGRKVIRDYLPEQHRDFYHQLPFVLIGTVAADGHAWAGVLEGSPGFAHSPEPRTLQLDVPLDPRDPCSTALQDGTAIGLLGIELHSRRRNRLNGQVFGCHAGGMSIAVDQAFGNCPQYIQLRQFQPPQVEVDRHLPAEQSDRLDPRAGAMIARADTFFVASYVQLADGRRAVDVSHRGGQAGFVRVEGNRLTIPDFAGNLHFNTLGNLLLNPCAGLLFIDFTTGDLLQLSGKTELTLEGEAIQAFQGAERLWHLEVEQVVQRPAALSLRWQFQSYSPHSLMTGNRAHADARLAATVMREQWRPWRVARIVENSSTIRSFYLVPADGAGIPTFRAGQHIPLRLHIPGQPHPLIRTYSLSRAPSDGVLRISVKRDGIVSTYLHEQLAVGDMIEARAPLGQFVLDDEQRRPVVLLGAGVGASPLLAMLREAVQQNGRRRRSLTVWWIQSARNLAELAFRDELRELQQRVGDSIHLVRVLSRPEVEARDSGAFELDGRIDIALLKALLPFDDYDFYLCGPGSFTQDLYDGLRALNISDQRIHAESFGPSSLCRRPDQAHPDVVLPPAANRAVPVLFAKSAKEARWTPASGSLLELAESRGLSPEFSCRGGSCGICKTRIVSGEVAYPQPPAAFPETGHALICRAVPAASADGIAPLVLDL